jgi:hypothetical protein
MIIKKSFARVLAIGVAVALCWSGIAEAKGGYTKSYRSGFSSQKKAAPSAPAYSANKPAAFGSFGGGKAADAKSAIKPSPMSQDLQASAAKNNALKNWDARAAGKAQPNQYNATNGGNNLPPVGGQPHYGQPNYQQPHYSQPIVHQTVVHQGGSGFLNGVMWFMIGNSFAHHNTNTVYVPQNTQGTYPVGVQQGSEWNNSAQAGVDQFAAVPEQESWMMKVLRVILWIAIATGVVWMVKKVFQFRRGRRRQQNHYSLGS